MTHLSLFTGIGGIDLACEWAGFKTIGQCEVADYPTKVLEKHWKDVPRWKNVRYVTADCFRERTGCTELTLLSGGFPCQPHSLVGKRKGSSDERDLWGEFRRVICEIKPIWVLGENVPGILTSDDGMFFGRVIKDLAEMGYRIGWGTFPAYAAGAEFRGDRVFILATSVGIRPHSMDKNKSNKRENLNMEIVEKEKARPYSVPLPMEWDISIRDCELPRNDYGVPEALDRFKCIGNAVMPQQVYPILHSIAQIERNKS